MTALSLRWANLVTSDKPLAPTLSSRPIYREPIGPPIRGGSFAGSDGAGSAGAGTPLMLRRAIGVRLRRDARAVRASTKGVPVPAEPAPSEPATEPPRTGRAAAVVLTTRSLKQMRGAFTSEWRSNLALIRVRRPAASPPALDLRLSRPHPGPRLTLRRPRRPAASPPAAGDAVICKCGFSELSLSTRAIYMAASPPARLDRQAERDRRRRGRGRGRGDVRIGAGRRRRAGAANAGGGGAGPAGGAVATGTGC
jgi:hypothetical protein